MTHILHIDTSGKKGIVMLSADGYPTIIKENNTEKDHAASINLMLEDILREEKLTFQEIDALAVCTGPGSYTGLRIGMATAKGICYANDKPLICNNKLELLPTEDVNTEIGNWISLLPARAGEYFILINTGSEEKNEPMHLMTEEVNEQLGLVKTSTNIFGKIDEDVIKQKNLIFNEQLEINTKLWAKMAYGSYQHKIFVNVATVEPLYLKQVFINKKP